MTTRYEEEPSAEPEPHARLAAGVFRQAILDLHHPNAGVRQMARNWLLEADDALEFWCAVSGLTVVEVRTCVRRMLSDD
jgi:hypothetical protein